MFWKNTEEIRGGGVVNILRDGVQNVYGHYLPHRAGHRCSPMTEEILRGLESKDLCVSCWRALLSAVMLSHSGNEKDI